MKFQPIQKLTREQHSTLLWMICIGTVYFLIFIPPNLTGAANAEMLSIFEVDEYAQYPSILQMLTPGDTLLHTLRNFLVYSHYYYGYPFYFISALSALPLRLVWGDSFNTHTSIIIMVMRQMVNVLPAILSCGLFTWMVTQFKNRLKSLVIFSMLLLVPGLILNNMWWHPDALGLLLVALVFFFLNRDQQSFGMDYYIAALLCGISIGVKYLGLFFVLSIVTYLVLGFIQKRLGFPRMALHALGFILLMALGLVLSNPLLLLPLERAEIISIQREQFVKTGMGYTLQESLPLIFGGKFPADLNIYYGEFVVWLAALAGLAAGCRNREKRVYHLVLAGFICALTMSLLLAATRRVHYYLPMMIPLLACVSNLLPDYRKFPEFSGLKKALSLVMAMLVLIQMGIFFWTGGNFIIDQMNREKESPAIHFYDSLEENVLPYLAETNLVVYRDWKVYFPISSNTRLEINWDRPDYAYIQLLQPDIILLEMENVTTFSDPATLEQAINSDRYPGIHQFYKDAAGGEIEGYCRVLQDSFGLAFVAEKWCENFPIR